MDAPPPDCQIEANPDVSGVGIRISIYALCLAGNVLTFLVSVLARDQDNAAAFARSAASTLGLQGLALLCTAVVQVAQRRLTLFHAIVVVHLLALLGVHLAPRARYRGNGAGRAAANAVLVALASAAFVAFNAHVWAAAPDLGPQPECNAQTVYVVFGVSVRAVDPVFRYVVLAALVAPPALFALFLLVGLPCYVAAWCSGRRRAGVVTNRGAMTGRRRHGVDCGRGCFHFSYDSDGDSVDYNDHTRLRREGVQAAGYAAFSIYAIVSLEQTISRNNLDPEESEWTFGQIIAIFMLIGTMYELLGVIISNLGSDARAPREEVTLVTPGVN